MAENMGLFALQKCIVTAYLWHYKWCIGQVLLNGVEHNNGKFEIICECNVKGVWISLFATTNLS
jgi:hypothetical protein